MRFSELAIGGAWRIELEPNVDERGWFARTFCATELAQHGIDSRIAQESVSWNDRRGTLRGMHLQLGDAAEGKHIRCTVGAAFDVLVDVRVGSPTYLRWVAEELTAANRVTLYAPPGVAHGFLTLEDSTEIEYRMTEPYASSAAVGHRWDDPAFGISWPFDPIFVSERDTSWPYVSHP